MDSLHSLRRREARAKRFGTKLVVVDGEPVKLVDRLPEIPDAPVRLEAVHLHGTNEMSTEDVLSYFKKYSPKNIEWVNDCSCNVVWEDHDTASRALLGLGRQPVALHSESSSDPPVLSSKSEERVEQSQDQVEEISEKNRIQDEPTGMNENGDRSMQGERGRAGGSPTGSSDRSPGSASPMDFKGSEGSLTLQWRHGETHTHAQQLLLRYATTQDVKKRGAARVSEYYMKYGRPSASVAPRQEDLRSRIGQKRLLVREEGEEEEGGSDPDQSSSKNSSFGSLIKRPKPMYSDRPDDLLDVTEMMGASEKERVLAHEDAGRVGLGDGKGDLRRALQRKKKRRSLKLRIGYSPRLVEEITR